MERWQGKTAIVTGAKGGIGSGIVHALATQEVNVVGLDLMDASEPKNKSGNGSVFYRQCDITNTAELKSAFEWVEEELGGVDIMVNCAGYAHLGHITTVGDSPVPAEDLMKTLDINIKALILCSRYAVDSMKRRGVDGHIVNINSIAGHYIPFTDQFNVYSCSKYGVTAFTQSLAHELATFGSRIRITSISPGLVQTPLSSNFVKDFTAVTALQPADIADAVVYALSRPPHVNVSEITVQPVAELRQ